MSSSYNFCRSIRTCPRAAILVHSIDAYSSSTELPDASIIRELATLSDDNSAHDQVKSAANTLSFYGQKVRDHRR